LPELPTLLQFPFSKSTSKEDIKYFARVIKIDS